MARNRFYQGPVSDHFDGERFFNPGQEATDRSLGALLRWRLAGGKAAWPESVAVTPARVQARVAGLVVTMVGHASVLIQAGGVNVLTDPVWSARASPVGFAGPRRVTAPGIGFDDLPPVDAVVISHCHYDHFDVATLRRLQAGHAPLFVVPLGCDTLLRAAVPGARCVAGDWWDGFVLAEGLRTTLTPAHHWASRSLWDRRMTLWCGHYLQTAAGAVWFVGDTGYGDGRIFGAIRARLGAPDLALIPIGAYEPRWFMAAQHVCPEEAVRVFLDVGARRALGIHWGTFRLTDEAREAPEAALAVALREAGIAPERFEAAVPGGVDAAAE